mmetsp:Transcript_23869/g.42347  ORF Transcript_23869/g.42347 Transcript_23869/m.42347 type:complete len:169 (-) Transcript_23869:217-723(-)|eukprot:CAMPEP_0178766142 /NCGR_PEP_ID=MMETSP0744-20121128/18880_1 /TAXON_ID=913974 /ORGANISM="Nitzschia punctata, Strain CCMP561" /LENGTH=168 /DNA_ID=CAMNT_0020421791 /DNA_START=133 /DNA_END=639 /DNA_ORIENTATION=-
MGGISKEKLLAIIGQVSQLHGGNGAPKELVAKRAGYTGGHKGQAFAKAIYRLKEKGFIEVRDGILYLTARGEEIAGTVSMEDIASSNKEQQEKMRSTLSPKQQHLFDLLLHGPRSRQDLAGKLGYESHTAQGFTKLLARVKAQNYIEFIENQMVQLTDLAFPYGRDEN